MLAGHRIREPRILHAIILGALCGLLPPPAAAIRSGLPGATGSSTRAFDGGGGSVSSTGGEIGAAGAARRSLLQQGCTSHAQCAGSPALPYCDTATGSCVSCVSNQHCGNPTPACNVTTHTCQICSLDVECYGSPGGPLCLNGVCAAPAAPGFSCNYSVPHCIECAARRFGTTTKSFCTRCDAGYVAATVGPQRGRACWCARGFYKTGDTCSACGYGYYCPGARVTEASGEARLPCGANKNTSGEYAMSPRECVVNPGFGWQVGDAVECPLGFYNPGMNTRRCTRCPGSLTTASKGAASPAMCMAPAGFFYSRGRAFPCARGSYKPNLGNHECTACPTGFTTPPEEVAQMAKESCSYLSPGYYAAPGAQLGVTPAAACPANTFSAGDVPYDPSTGHACTPCGPGLATPPSGGGLATSATCLAPPGHGYNLGNSSAVICPAGSFNEGWNKEPCRPCGAGSVTTDGPGAQSSSYCQVPPGHGAAWMDDGTTLSSGPCPAGTYGRPNATYGLAEVECTRCLVNMFTLSEGSTSFSDCRTEPGYGYSNGVVALCGAGSYSPGGGLEACLSCGAGRTTSVNGSLFPSKGAASAADCVAAAGWTSDGAWAVVPCERGSYKALIGPQECTRCPSGTTTSAAMGASSLSFCDSCRPGFGSAFVSQSSPSCPVCGSGYYSPGSGEGGAACTACPLPAGYVGVMVSRKGTMTSDGCFPEFVTDAALAALGYDVIPMPGANVLAVQSDLRGSSDTLANCQARCEATVSCQYFIYDAGQPKGSRCSVRNLGVTPANFSDPGQSKILFQVKEGVYVSYIADPSDWGSTGIDIATYATQALAQAACDQQGGCAGIKYSAQQPAGQDAWRAFKGGACASCTSKVRATGIAINPWIPEPDPHDPAVVCSPACDSTHGTCVAGQLTNTCMCQPGWKGAQCNLPDDSAAPTTTICNPACAAGRGTCIGGMPTNWCYCSPGWTGDTCSVPVCSSGCNGGTCTAPNTCDCTGTGFTGATCSVPVCAPSCANNGTCAVNSTTGAHQCDCAPGWQGASCTEQVITHAVDPSAKPSSLVTLAAVTCALDGRHFYETPKNNKGAAYGFSWTDGTASKAPSVVRVEFYHGCTSDAPPRAARLNGAAASVAVDIPVSAACCGAGAVTNTKFTVEFTGSLAAAYKPGQLNQFTLDNTQKTASALNLVPGQANQIAMVTLIYA